MKRAEYQVSRRVVSSLVNGNQAVPWCLGACQRVCLVAAEAESERGVTHDWYQ